MAGQEVFIGSGEFAGEVIGDVHGESYGLAEVVASLVMYDQYYLVSAFWSSAEDSSGDTLARCFDGTSLVCFSYVGYGEELPANYGL